MTPARVVILYGTESGNAEMVADDVAEALTGLGWQPQVLAMDEYELFELVGLAGIGRVVLVTSTYGEGGLPETAEPLHDALLTEKPDLSGLEFSAFGLGDSTYDTYNNAVDVVSSAFLGLGARQTGDTGRHDAASGEDPSERAVAWAREIFPRR